MVGFIYIIKNTVNSKVYIGQTRTIDLYDSTNKSKGYNVSIGGNTPKFKRKTLSISDLIDLYVNKHFTLQEIANKFEVTRYIICTELRNAGIHIRTRNEANSKFDIVSKEVILNALNNTKSLRSAAKYANIPYPTFRKACIYNKIEYNSSKSARQ